VRAETLKKRTLEGWVGQILATEDHELSCSECFDSLSVYVERELAQIEPDARMLQLEQHLGQCLVCREEYEMLRALVSGEAGDAPQST